MSDKSLSRKGVARNFLLSIFAQAVSLCVSLILSLIVPRFVPEFDYAYWQMFLLYSGYVGVLHFGLLDGLVLRYSQFDYDELNKPLISSQFQLLFVWMSFAAVLTALVAAVFFDGFSKTVIILVGLGIITKNIVTYSSYLLQITNRIDKYARLVIAQRLAYGFAIVLLLLFGIHSFYWLCIADLLGDLTAIAIGVRYNRNLFFSDRLPLRSVLPELWENIRAGIILMLANWSSMLIAGGSKMVIQWHWDPITFGKVAFAFSASNLFLVFISALSVVLFPSLKRVRTADLPEIYAGIRETLSLVLVAILIFYYPGCLILEFWLPKYRDSLIYLGVLLPLILFSSKSTLLTNTYLKALRGEKRMLTISFVCVGLAAVGYALSAYLLESIQLTLLVTVLVMMIRSILSEIAVMRELHISDSRDFWIEGLMSCVFFISVYYFRLSTGFLIYLSALVLYFFFYRERFRRLIHRILLSCKKQS